MQSSIEQLEGLIHQLTLELPASQLEQAVTAKLKHIGQRVKIDGFRPKKIPLQVIKNKYGAAALHETIEELIHKTYIEALKKGNYRVAGNPEKIEVLSGLKKGEPLKYQLQFEVLPEVEVKGLDNLTITLPKSKVSDVDVDEMVNTLRRQQANFVISDKKAETDDRITLDFVGKLDGEAFEGGSGENVSFVIGGKQMLPDFEEGVKGAEKDQEINFDVTFPENYGVESLNGKIANFNAKIKQIEKMVLPELTADFIKNFGIASGEEADFRKAIKDNMVRELDNALRRIKRDRLLDAILEKNVDQIVPKTSVKQEIERLSNEMNLAKQIPDEAKRSEIAEKIFGENAQRRAKLSLLLGKLFDEKQLTLDQERVKARVDSIASTYESPDEVRQFYQKDLKTKMNLESAILEEQLIDSIYDDVKVSFEEKNFQEIMALNTQIRN